MSSMKFVICLLHKEKNFNTKLDKISLVQYYYRSLFHGQIVEL